MRGVPIARNVLHNRAGVVTAAYVNVSSLFQNFPNPFNPRTVVSYHLPAASDVRLVAYDMLGREVSVPANEKKMAGSYPTTFDGSAPASGVYFYRLRARQLDGVQAADFAQT